MIDVDALFAVEQGFIGHHPSVAVTSLEHTGSCAPGPRPAGGCGLQQQAHALHLCRRLRQWAEHTRRHLHAVDIDQGLLWHRAQAVAAGQVGAQQQLTAGRELLDQAARCAAPSCASGPQCSSELRLRLSQAVACASVCSASATCKAFSDALAPR